MSTSRDYSRQRRNRNEGPKTARRSIPRAKRAGRKAVRRTATQSALRTEIEGARELEVVAKRARRFRKRRPTELGDLMVGRVFWAFVHGRTSERRFRAVMAKLRKSYRGFAASYLDNDHDLVRWFRWMASDAKPAFWKALAEAGGEPAGQVVAPGEAADADPRRGVRIASRRSSGR